MFTELALIPAPFKHWKGYCHLILSDLIIIQFCFFTLFPCYSIPICLHFTYSTILASYREEPGYEASTISLTAGA